MLMATTDSDYATAATAMHAAERLPKQYGLNVDKYTYENLSRFLPTSLEIGQAMRGYKVEMSPATTSKVYETVAAQAALVKQWLQAEQRNTEADNVTVWTDTAVSRQATDIVLSPLNSLTLGTISHRDGKPTMTLNEELLDQGGRNRLAATTQHELIHHATGQADFDFGRPYDS